MFTYGPNTALVERVIEQAEMATSWQAEALLSAVVYSWNDRYATWAYAWNAAQDAAWDNALDSAWYAALDAARYAAWDGEDAPWHAVRDAAFEAAGACVVRHLITPDQFDILTAPWVALFGPLSIR
jgi:hypothetical protein